MRICFVATQIAAWGKIGGFGVTTRRLGRALVKAGVEVHAVVPRRPGQARVEDLDGIVVHGQSKAEVFFDRRLYREVDADVYHMMEPSLCGYWARRAMPDRVHVASCLDPRERPDWRVELRWATGSRRLKYPVQKWYEDGPLVRRAVRAAHGVYVWTPLLQEKAMRLYGLARAPGLLPKPLEIPEGPFGKAERPRCVFLARLDPRKRPERFFQLAERMPEVDFVAVGRAHDASYQRHLARRYFHLPNLDVVGFVDPFEGDALGRILGPAWVLVHPAAREALPTAFQEASLHEVAVLANVDPDGYVSRFGRVAAEEGGAGALERALREMLESGEWRQQGRAGRAYNRTHHSLPLSVEAHLKVYQQHLAAARR